MNYVIGAGPAAGIVKHFVKCKCIALNANKTPPINCLWATPSTEKYMKDKTGQLKTKKVKYAAEGDNFLLYNRLTCKPLNSMPTNGRGELNIIDYNIPSVDIDYKDKVEKITAEGLFTLNKGLIKLKPKEKVFVASPITYQIDNKMPIEIVEYSPVKVYTIQSSKELVEPAFYYKYLLSSRYLNEGIYRITREDSEKYKVESKKALTDDILKDVFEADIKILGNYELKYAHFKKLQDFKWPKNFLPISRASRLEHNFLLSDIFELLEGNDGR